MSRRKTIPRSAFEGQTNTTHSTMMRKVEVARKQGARAILVVDDPNHRTAPDRFRRWLREPQAEDFGTPGVLHVAGSRAAALGNAG